MLNIINRIEELKSLPSTEHNLYLMSLMYRYLDQYKNEKSIIEQALNLFPNAYYMQERKKWHDLPSVEKMVPRKPFNPSRHNRRIPRQETLDQFCFVTGCDGNYLHYLIELLESIQATQLYKNTPVCIIDGGLNDDQKHYLTSNFPIKYIRDPGLKVDIPWFTAWDGEAQLPVHSMAHWFKVILARPFLPEIFPEYRYYFLLDADLWVHDERSIDFFISMCEDNGNGIIGHSCFNLIDHDVTYNKKFVAKQYVDEMRQYRNVNVGCNCLDRDSGLFEEWSKFFRQTVKTQGVGFNTEEQTFNYVLHTKLKLRHFVNKYRLNPIMEGTPIVFDDPNLLYRPDNLEPIGIWSPYPKDTHYFPTEKRSEPFTKEEHALHQRRLGSAWSYVSELREKHQKDITYIIEDRDQKIIFPNQTWYSLRYRVLPWADKPEIKAILEKEVQGINF